MSGGDQPFAEQKEDEDKSDDEEQLKIVEENEQHKESSTDGGEASVAVVEDIYGRPVIKSVNGSEMPSTYLPPHLRRKRQAEAEVAAAAAATDKVKPLQMDEQAVRELRRRINGQLNRISEPNMEYVVCDCTAVLF